MHERPLRTTGCGSSAHSSNVFRIGTWMAALPRASETPGRASSLVRFGRTVARVAVLVAGAIILIYGTDRLSSGNILITIVGAAIALMGVVVIVIGFRMGRDSVP